MAAQLFYSVVVLLFYAAPAAGWGLCNDDNPACGYWAKNGECDGANKEFMQKTCPHSCGMCHLLCRDVEDSCATWAKDGHCESNPGFMFKSCPTACGVCHPKCYDKEPDDKCGDWARAGECTKNPAILSSCPISCGVCTSLCLDKLNDCPQWAAAGDCSKNREFMLKECPRSCDLCGDEDAAKTEAAKKGTPQADSQEKHSKCANKDHHQCLLWGEQECSVNPLSLLTTCPAMCGACTTVCVDKARDCPNWARAGKACENDPHLPALCPSSCGICSAIHVKAPPDKQEL